MQRLGARVDLGGSCADGSQRREVENQGANICARDLCRDSRFSQSQQQYYSRKYEPLEIVSSDNHEIRISCKCARRLEAQSVDRRARNQECRLDWTE
jgi:hypothetical protein